MIAAPVSIAIGEFVGHGGRTDRARAAFPQVKDWLDLSTGIAPWPYPIGLEAASLRSLPDPAALAALEAQAAAAFGCAVDRIVAVPGTDMALRLLGTLLPGPAGWLTPGYSGHGVMWQHGEARALQRGKIAEAADMLRTIILARPNNPDGWTADAALIESAASRLAARDGQLIVDEAFADAGAEDDLAHRDWPGLAVLRSFGKFFGLAGLRLGFVIGPPALADRLRGLLGDWPIATPALTVGLAAYADFEWQESQRARLAEAQQAMTALLARHELAVVGGTRYFTLVASSARDALFVHLAAHGILTRPFADRPEWLRIGMPGTARDWSRFADALSAWRRG